MNKIITAAVIIIILSACCGSRGPRIRAGFTPRINLVEIIYKGLDDKVLFAGPVKFREKEGKDIVQMDFTTEFKNKTSDSVTFRFTVTSQKQDFTFTRISFISSDTLFTSSAVQLMFKETHKKDFRYRYVFTTSYSNFRKFLDTKSATVSLGNGYTFETSKRWAKEANEISSKILLITSGYL